MMRDEDIPWAELKGGYKILYDPRPALAAVEAGAGTWDELWEELHHQGDVGEASYAAVPIIARIADGARDADYNPFSLAITIEEARRQSWNPDLPAWLLEDYAAAWDRLFQTAHRLLPEAADETLVAALLAVFALRKEQPCLARMAHDFTEFERGEMLKELGLA